MIMPYGLVVGLDVGCRGCGEIIRRLDRMKLRDKYGWPVVTIKGRPFTNFMRRLLITNIAKTWQKRKTTLVGSLSSDVV